MNHLLSCLDAIGQLDQAAELRQRMNSNEVVSLHNFFSTGARAEDLRRRLIAASNSQTYDADGEDVPHDFSDYTTRLVGHRNVETGIKEATFLTNVKTVYIIRSYNSLIYRILLDARVTMGRVCALKKSQ